MIPWAAATTWEALTNRVEKEAYEYFRRIEDVGGVVAALESGFFQREIADAAYIYQREEDRRDRVTVGVNDYVTDEELSIPLLRVDREGEAQQVKRLNHIRQHQGQPGCCGETESAGTGGPWVG